MIGTKNLFVPEQLQQNGQNEAAIRPQQNYGGL